MTSITLDLFSGKGLPVNSISVPVVSLRNYHDKLLPFTKDRLAQGVTIDGQKNIVCRELFQKIQNELFLFPCGHRKSSSLKCRLSGRLFFLKGVYGWNFILIFTPEKLSRSLVFAKVSKFSQEDEYPEGADSAEPFSLSNYCASVLVSEHGCIAKDSEGQLFFQGITVSLLQTSKHQLKSILVQRRDIFASPKPPLREEDLSSLKPRTCKFIKIFCFCRKKNFSYSTHFSVLTPEAAEEKLRNNIEQRLEKYGASSIRYRVSDTKEMVTNKESSQPLLIIAPPMMEADVPFGSCRKGKLFFSYSDQLECTLQLLFFPYLFSPKIKPKITQQCAQNWYIKDVGSLIKCCKVVSATVFSFPGIKLVPSSEFEYKIIGMNVELVSAPIGNCWGVFCSPERNLSLDSLTQGPSGLGYSKPAASLSQSTVTISVSSEKQGKQTQRRSPLPGPSGVRHHPCPYGPLPLCGGLYSYRYPITFQPQAAATVSVSSESKNLQTQQDRSSPPGPSGIGNRAATATLSQAEATVDSLPERQGKQKQKRNKKPVSGSSGVRHQVIHPIPIHPSAGSIVSALPERQSQQTPHTQQRDIRNLVLGPFGVRHHPYLQHGPLPFSGESHPYFYPETGSFVGAVYPYGSPSPPCPHPSARQDQWMSVFPPSFSFVRPFSEGFELIRYNISVQEGVGHSERAEEANASVSVGAVQQTPIWRPDEESSNVEILPQVQAENSDADTDIDVEN